MTTAAATRRTLAPALSLRTHGVYAALGLVIVFNLLFTPNFATMSNVRLQLVQVTPVVIVALGMAVVIATAGVDLSVGAIMALVGRHARRDDRPRAVDRDDARPARRPRRRALQRRPRRRRADPADRRHARTVHRRTRHRADDRRWPPDRDLRPDDPLDRDQAPPRRLPDGGLRRLRPDGGRRDRSCVRRSSASGWSPSAAARKRPAPPVCRCGGR